MCSLAVSFESWFGVVFFFLLEMHFDVGLNQRTSRFKVLTAGIGIIMTTAKTAED